MACIAYSNTLESSFHLDDERAIWDNPPVLIHKITWDNLKKAAFESKIRTRPVSHVTFAFNYYFHQLEVRGYHIVNIIIHISTGILLFYLLKATLTLPALRGKYGSGSASAIAFLTAAIWLLHPIQTQSVTYIVQRMTSMCAMFYILAMLLYVRARLARRKKARWMLFAGCILSGILALGSKENAATLPFFIFLYEWYFLQDLRVAVSPYRRQWILLTIALAVLTGLTLVYLGGDPFRNILSSYERIGFSLTQKLLTEARVLILYVSLLSFPHLDRLNLDYDFMLSQSIVSPPATFFSVTALIGLAFFAILMAKKQRLFSFAILWFLGNLAIESSFIPLELVFEHRTYLPSMFFLLIAIIPLHTILRHKKYALYAVTLAILTLFPYWTFERNKVWADELTLWQDCLEKAPNKWRVHNNLGKEYFRRWETDKAIYHYQKTIELNPYDSLPRMNLASALAMKGRHQEAIIQLEIVLNREPANAKARTHLLTNRQLLQKQMNR